MSVPELPPLTLPIVPWVDPVIDSLGFDPRSTYVETFWLGILGPSTTLLLRRIAGESVQSVEMVPELIIRGSA